MKPKCPFCDMIQTGKSLKSWEYRGVEVNRYVCKCGKPFNFFLTKKNKSWTIPKQKE